MISFKEHLLNESKNLHMTHAEDAVIDGGVNGTRNVINYFRGIRDMLSGKSSTSVNLSVKWDGAPALFAGIDPRDGKFFIAKKGVFNKNPKIYKTAKEIDDDDSVKGDLNAKFKVALAELSKLGIEGVVQGDFLFTNEDLSKTTIDGESYITFHPNTIVYAIPENSALAKRISKSKIGVVWHTRYRGQDFESMSASFGEKIASNFKEVNSVWAVDAVFEDKSGSATMTQAETDEITKILSDAGRVFRTVRANILRELAENSELNMRVNTYINSKIRQGSSVGDPKGFVIGLVQYIQEYYQKEMDKKKSEQGKKVQKDKADAALKMFTPANQKEIEKVFVLYNHIVDAKHFLLNKLNQVQGMKTFLKTNRGYEVTNPEGFVVIDRLGKNTLKLVDRLEFSKANFSPEYIKGWQK
jgi:hypothetical protein